MALDRDASQTRAMPWRRRRTALKAAMIKMRRVGTSKKPVEIAEARRETETVPRRLLICGDARSRVGRC